MIGIYPGTFDPITRGHLDIIRRAGKIVERLVVAVGDNPGKVCTFDTETRMQMIRECIGDAENVGITSFKGLMVEAAREVGASVVIRGLRAISDYELEVQMALINRRLDPDLDTIILVASVDCSFISSSLIKEIAWFGGDVSKFVPEPVVKYLKKANPRLGPEQ